MSDTEIMVLNDTGFHPQPGFVLLEHIDVDTGRQIVIPPHLRKENESQPSSYDEFKIIVLEDGDNKLSPGTKVMTTARDGFTHRGRKLLMATRESIIATVD